MAASTSSTHINIRVLVATTGVTYKVSLLPTELTVANIRGHLAAAVPHNDQILLLGPPYKVPKDATLQSDEVLESLRMGDEEDNNTYNNNAPGHQQQHPQHQQQQQHPATNTTTTASPTASGTEPQPPAPVPSPPPLHRRPLLDQTKRSGARRLFLFSKQALSDQSPDTITPCVLEPQYATILPTEPPGPSLLAPGLVLPHQPLHQALAAYERQFMLYLAQGRSLMDGTDVRVRVLRKCVHEQSVLCRALRAAVSNLADHFAAAARTRAEFSVVFTERTGSHHKLLHNFDSILVDDLAHVPLDPALTAIAWSSGRTMNTLLDTVPVERERTWAQQCQKSHQRLSELYRELDVAFGDLGTAADRQMEMERDGAAEAAVERLWTELDDHAVSTSHRQAQRLETLTTGHGEVLQIITHALNGTDADIQQSFSPLQEKSTSFGGIVAAMKLDDEGLVTWMGKVADAKTEAMRRMKVRLREVSLAQSSIQRVLASVGVLRDALNQQTDNMVHLEHVAQLSNSYKHFLSEIARRRAYGKAVTATSVVMMERLAALREDELKEREKFLRGPGQHLMPVFFETFVPTLATPPPLFTPQLPGIAELDALPQLGCTATTGGMAAAVADDASAAAMSVMATSVRQSDTIMDESAQHDRQQQQQQQQQQQENLIVSADETSATILDPTAAAVADAELKTLAYENATLRQALERLGGKPPRKYMEESRQRDFKLEAKELESLRHELTEAKTKVQDAADEIALLKAQQEMADHRNQDKISHSSFEVGDVGLFMPTGRSLGKPTYLAFHTGCPNRFLSPDCVKGSPDFVLGRIVYQEKKTAGEVGTADNPFGINAGATFYLLTVEILKPTPK